MTDLRVVHERTVVVPCPDGGNTVYRVAFSPDKFLAVQEFDDICSFIDQCGAMYQETFTRRLSDILPFGTLRTIGMHSRWTETTCELTRSEATG